jgi:hypothetical protein
MGADGQRMNQSANHTDLSKKKLFPKNTGKSFDFLKINFI